MFEPPARALRFVSAEVETLSPERCRARVELAYRDGSSHVSAAEGSSAGTEPLRLAAQAAATAVLSAVGSPGDQIAVTGLTLAEAFGKRTVFVQVAAEYRGQHRELMGFCLIDPDPARAAALAVLNAVNRFLGVG